MPTTKPDHSRPVTGTAEQLVKPGHGFETGRLIDVGVDLLRGRDMRVAMDGLGSAGRDLQRPRFARSVSWRGGGPRARSWPGRSAAVHATVRRWGASLGWEETSRFRGSTPMNLAVSVTRFLDLGNPDH